MGARLACRRLNSLSKSRSFCLVCHSVRITLGLVGPVGSHRDHRNDKTGCRSVCRFREFREAITRAPISVMGFGDRAAVRPTIVVVASSRCRWRWL